MCRVHGNSNDTRASTIAPAEGGRLEGRANSFRGRNFMEIDASGNKSQAITSSAWWTADSPSRRGFAYSITAPPFPVSDSDIFLEVGPVRGKPSRRGV